MVYTLDEIRGRVFSVDEVARLLGVTPDAVRRRVRLGQLPVRRPPGSEMFFSGDDLAAYFLGETPAAKPPRRAAPRATAPDAPAPAPARPRAVALPAAPAVLPFRLPDEARDRLRAWMRATGRDQGAVSREAGINASSLSYIIGESETRKRRALCRDNALRLRDAYGDDLLRWLLGAGPMPEA